MSLIFKFTFSTELKDDKKTKKLEHRKQLQQANNFITSVSNEVGLLRLEKEELKKALADVEEQLETCKKKLTVSVDPQVARYMYVILVSCSSHFNKVFLGKPMRTSVSECLKAKRSKSFLPQQIVQTQKYVIIGLLLFGFY